MRSVCCSLFTLNCTCMRADTCNVLTKAHSRLACATVSPVTQQPPLARMQHPMRLQRKEVDWLNQTLAAASPEASGAQLPVCVELRSVECNNSPAGPEIPQSLTERAKGTCTKGHTLQHGLLAMPSSDRTTTAATMGSQQAGSSISVEADVPKHSQQRPLHVSHTDYTVTTPKWIAMPRSGTPPQHKARPSTCNQLTPLAIPLTACTLLHKRSKH